MHRFLSLLLLPVLSLPAGAADPPKACDAPAHAVRQSWEQQFARANVAHDGHLTPAEAKDGYADVARHFDDIDVEHKGYVTANDIRAWRIMRKAAHRLAKPPEEKARPRSAVQRSYPEFQAINVAGKQPGFAPAGSPDAGN